MSKVFSTLLFSFLLLSQTTLYAEEASDMPDESHIEEVTKEAPVEVSSEPQEGESTSEAEIEEPQEEVSEAQREADAAEAAELQEVGEGEEPSAQ